MAEAPKVFLTKLEKAFAVIGKGDIEAERADVATRLNIRAKGLVKSFKAKTTDPGRATDLSKLFADLSTRWTPAGIFQSGGTIVGHGQSLTVLTDAARGPSGRRKFTAQKIRQMIADGLLRFVPTPRGVLLVQSKGGLSKTGKMRKGSADIIIAILRKQVTEPKRLQFLEIFNSRNEQHIEALEFAIENTLAEIAASKTAGG